MPKVSYFVFSFHLGLWEFSGVIILIAETVKSRHCRTADLALKAERKHDSSVSHTVSGTRPTAALQIPV